MSVDWWDDMGDVYAAADATTMGWSLAPTSVQTGRLAGGCFRINNGVRTKAVPAGSAKTVGFAWRPNAGVLGARNVFGFLEGPAIEHVRLRYNGDGTMTVSRAGTALTGGTTGVVIGSATWFAIELSVVIHDSAGSFELRVNGSTVASGSGLDTRNGGTGDATLIRLGEGVSACNDDWDDLWVANTASEWYGDLRVDAALPNSDGGVSQWTPSTGSAHYAVVDDATPGGDTDYLSDSTAGHRDVFGYPSLPVGSGATVVGVAERMWARKDDAGTRTLDAVARIGGVNYDNGSAFGLSTSYAAYEGRWLQNPATGSAWTVAGVNGAELGIKEVA